MSFFVYYIFQRYAFNFFVGSPVQNTIYSK